MAGLRGDVVVLATPPLASSSSFHHQDHPSLIDSHHDRHHHHHSININNSSNTSSSTALGVGGGVVPMGEDADNMNRNQSSSSGNGIQLWKNQHSLQNPNLFFNSAAGGGVNVISSARRSCTSVSTTGSTITCHDCGNQAKKDCSHRRCRTCCKSRGFDCATHVKSTWVPASRRRERQLLTAASTVGVAGGSSSSTTSHAGVKKPRLISSQTTTSHTSTSTSARSFDTSSIHQDASFREALPRQLLAPAVFKCVRVSAIEDGDQDEYAYQAVVKIGGHVFKGFLYDQGVIDDDERNGLFPNISDLHLGGINSNNNSTAGDGIRQGMMTSSSSPIIDPSTTTTTTVYVKSGSGGLLGGTDHYSNQH